MKVLSAIILFLSIQTKGEILSDVEGASALSPAPQGTGGLDCAKTEQLFRSMVLGYLNGVYDDFSRSYSCLSGEPIPTSKQKTCESVRAGLENEMDRYRDLTRKFRTQIARDWLAKYSDKALVNSCVGDPKLAELDKHDKILKLKDGLEPFLNSSCQVLIRELNQETFHKPDFENSRLMDQNLTALTPDEKDFLLQARGKAIFREVSDFTKDHVDSTHEQRRQEMAKKFYQLKEDTKRLIANINSLKDVELYKLYSFADFYQQFLEITSRLDEPEKRRKVAEACFQQSYFLRDCGTLKASRCWNRLSEGVQDLVPILGASRALDKSKFSSAAFNAGLQSVDEYVAAQSEAFVQGITTAAPAGVASSGAKVVSRSAGVLAKGAAKVVSKEIPADIAEDAVPIVKNTFGVPTPEFVAERLKSLGLKKEGYFLELSSEGADNPLSRLLAKYQTKYGVRYLDHTNGVSRLVDYDNLGNPIISLDRDFLIRPNASYKMLKEVENELAMRVNLKRRGVIVDNGGNLVSLFGGNSRLTVIIRNLKEKHGVRVNIEDYNFSGASNSETAGFARGKDYIAIRKEYLAPGNEGRLLSILNHEITHTTTTRKLNARSRRAISSANVVQRTGRAIQFRAENSGTFSGVHPSYSKSFRADELEARVREVFASSIRTGDRLGNIDEGLGFIREQRRWLEQGLQQGLIRQVPEKQVYRLQSVIDGKSVNIDIDMNQYRTLSNNLKVEKVKEIVQERLKVLGDYERRLLELRRTTRD